jgi:hypothetical protein
MNVERLKAEAERLRNWKDPNRHFDMRGYIVFTRTSPNEPCRTTCCIAGDIFLKHSGFNPFPNGQIDPRPHQNSTVYAFAKDYLDLTERQADWLFDGQFTSLPMDEITPELAARAVDLLIACDGRLFYDENYKLPMLS